MGSKRLLSSTIKQRNPTRPAWQALARTCIAASSNPDRPGSTKREEGPRPTGSELGRQAVEEGLEAELETVVGCRRVVGGGLFEAGSQPRELSRNLSGLDQAVAADLPGADRPGPGADSL